jgi:hypothetical protein
MRKTIMKLIELTPAVTAEIPLDRWFQASSVQENPEKPFGVYRLAGTGPGVTRRSGSREVRLELWIHDEPGSYLRIDRLLTALESTLDAVVHASAAEGESISQTAFDSRSPDLDDSGFGSITKATIYTLIGKGQ